MKLSVGKIGLVLACVLVGGGCKKNGPTNPGGSTSCRTYATNSTTVTALQGVQFSTLSSTFSFNTSTRLGTGTNTYSDTTGCNYVASTSLAWDSVADFVDEVLVIPPRQLVRTATTMSTSGTCVINSSLTYSYDAQKRLTQFVVLNLTYAYSAWDTSGRPTSGNISGSGSPITEAFTYNDAARTKTLVQTSPALLTTTVYSYDANGNPTGTSVTSGPSVATSTITTTGTQQVCK